LIIASTTSRSLTMIVTFLRRLARRALERFVLLVHLLHPARPMRLRLARHSNPSL
jgi:hypothetical protein